MIVHVKPHNQAVREISIEDVNLGIACGEFDGRELAWIPGLAEWTTLYSIPGVSRPQPPPLPEASSQTSSLKAKPSQPLVAECKLSTTEFIPDRFEKDQAPGWRGFKFVEHPQAWRRFWARLIDIGIARICLELTVLVLSYSTGFWPPYDSQPIVAFVGTFIMWVIFLMLYEAVLLSMFGTTLGKLLFRTRVLRVDGSNLSFREALIRAHGAIGSGMFYLIAFPGLTLWAINRAYKDLAANGRSSWDIATGSVVRCRPVHFALYTAGVILAICTLLGYMVLREHIKQEFKRATIKQTINHL